MCQRAGLDQCLLALSGNPAAQASVTERNAGSGRVVVRVEMHRDAVAPAPGR